MGPEFDRLPTHNLKELLSQEQSSSVQELSDLNTFGRETHSVCSRSSSVYMSSYATHLRGVYLNEPLFPCGFIPKYLVKRTHIYLCISRFTNHQQSIAKILSIRFLLMFLRVRPHLNNYIVNSIHLKFP